MKKNKNNQTEGMGNTAVENSSPKRKKKRKKTPIIIAVAVIVLLVAWMVSCSLKPVPAAPVTTTTATRGELQESISTSGTVGSGEQKTYFAPLAGVLGEVKVAAGDAVKKGDLLVSFDMEEMDRILKQAALQYTVSKSSYQGVLSENSKNQQKLSEAQTNLPVLEQQIKDNESYLKQLKENLQKSQRDTSNALAEESFHLNNKSAQLQKELASLNPSDPEYAAKSQQLAELSAAASRNSYLQSVASSTDYVAKMNQEIEDVQARIADYREYKARMESQKEAGENASLNTYKKEEYSANHELAELTYEQAEENYYRAKEGIVAEFDGIVTSCAAVEGATVTNGLQLLTLENSSDVKVTFSASKYDLAKLELGQKADINISDTIYAGTVSKINRMAEPNQSNTPMVGVEISIDEPDEKIILGLDAKIQIFTHKVENALLVPVEAINADKDGDFLYVVENNVVVRKPVVCGISSDTYTEITEGITESDQIVLSILTGGTLQEGMAVTPINGLQGMQQ